MRQEFKKGDAVKVTNCGECSNCNYAEKCKPFLSGVCIVVATNYKNYEEGITIRNKRGDKEQFAEENLVIVSPIEMLAAETGDDV